MAKRIMAAILCLVLLVAALPARVSAETTREEEMKKQCARIYRRTLYNTGHSSLSGLCGLMTGYQLWLLDTTKSAEVYNGNDFFEAYSAQTHTSAGNRVWTYSADTYDLAEALYTVSCGGTQDVYNLVACFQRTNTRAGARYGHAVVIHAILGGQIYFVEGFHTSLGGAAGSPIVCSIEEFVTFFSDWTTYEGLVVLGKRDYTDYCTVYPGDLFICADNAQLLSQPSPLDTNGSTLLRTTGRNEVFHTSGIYENTEKQLFYRVTDGQAVGYISSQEAQIRRINTESVTLQIDAAEIQEDGALQLQGKILSTESFIQAVELQISDAAGNTVLTVQQDAGGRQMDLAQLNSQLTEVPLQDGRYTLQLTGVIENGTPVGGLIYMRQQACMLWQTTIPVLAENAVPADSRQVSDGWFWDGQTRYYYQDGAPRVGWFCEDGADYYFREDGSVTTGWVQINGRYRCFTEAGVMRTGWIETSRGMCYMLSNGVAAEGLRQIDGKLYYFDMDGLLVAQGTVTVDDVAYNITDGIATPA